MKFVTVIAVSWESPSMVWWNIIQPFHPLILRIFVHSSKAKSKVGCIKIRNDVEKFETIFRKHLSCIGRMKKRICAGYFRTAKITAERGKYQSFCCKRVDHTSLRGYTKLTVKLNFMYELWSWYIFEISPAFYTFPLIQWSLNCKRATKSNGNGFILRLTNDRSTPYESFKDKSLIEL